jgi:hypothetical protein
LTGATRPLPEFSAQGGRTTVPLAFEPLQSVFVVFRPEPGRPSTGTGRNQLALKPWSEIYGPWEVSFDPKWGGPEQITFEGLDDWSKRPEKGIHYYSGTAVYHRSFDLPPGGVRRRPLLLDLGVVKNVARVRLNGQDLGVLWCAPWRVDISRWVKEQGNRLEITVANLWPNRLIGDEQEPPDCEWQPGEPGDRLLKELPEWVRNAEPRPSKGRFCFTTWNPFTKDSPLLPSGLLGPVRLLVEEPSAGRNSGL